MPSTDLIQLPLMTREQVEALEGVIEAGLSEDTVETPAPFALKTVYGVVRNALHGEAGEGADQPVPEEQGEARLNENDPAVELAAGELWKLRADLDVTGPAWLNDPQADEWAEWAYAILDAACCPPTQQEQQPPPPDSLEGVDWPEIWIRREEDDDPETWEVWGSAENDATPYDMQSPLIRLYVPATQPTPSVDEGELNLPSLWKVIDLVRAVEATWGSNEAPSWAVSNIALQAIARLEGTSLGEAAAKANARTTTQQPAEPTNGEAG